MTVLISATHEVFGSDHKDIGVPISSKGHFTLDGSRISSVDALLFPKSCPGNHSTKVNWQKLTLGLFQFKRTLLTTDIVSKKRYRNPNVDP